MRRLSAKIKRPVTFALVQVDADPDLWRDLMDMTTAARGRGCRPMAAGRGASDRPVVGALHHLLHLRRRSGLPRAQGATA